MSQCCKFINLMTELFVQNNNLIMKVSIICDSPSIASETTFRLKTDVRCKIKIPERWTQKAKNSIREIDILIQ